MITHAHIRRRKILYVDDGTAAFMYVYFEQNKPVSAHISNPELSDSCNMISYLKINH